MALLHIHQLTVRFGGLTAVDRLDLEVQPGEVYSVIGPNGAGKTSVFNAVSGVSELSGGRVTFQGRELARPFTWKVAAVWAFLIGERIGLARTAGKTQLKDRV